MSEMHHSDSDVCVCVAAEVITVVPVLRDPAVYYQADKIFFIFTVILLTRENAHY